MVPPPRRLVSRGRRRGVRDDMRQWLVLVMVVALAIGVGVALERRNFDGPSRFQTVAPIDCPSMPFGGYA